MCPASRPCEVRVLPPKPGQEELRALLLIQADSWTLTGGLVVQAFCLWLPMTRGPSFRLHCRHGC